MGKKVVAEFLGTFLLVFCGTGAIVIDEFSHGAVTHPGIAATFGLTVFVLVLAFGPISGAHLNPAVSLTFFARKDISPQVFGWYVPAQISGGIGASLLLHFLFPQNEMLGTTLPAGSVTQSFLLEIALTFFLVLAIIRGVENKYSIKTIAAMAGTVVGLEALFAGPVCGASMNPARSIGPALVSGHTEHLWIYIAAPVLGALAAFSFNYLFRNKL
ncbi:MAG TPA: aquaporin [Bacteroidia bacterium]|nr:aquaporin [Bacteroidia bacterium]